MLASCFHRSDGEDASQGKQENTQQERIIRVYPRRTDMHLYWKMINLWIMLYIYSLAKHVLLVVRQLLVV